MTDAGPNWSQIAITGKRRARDEFGRSGSDPNLVSGRVFFGERPMRAAEIARKPERGAFRRLVI